MKLYVCPECHEILEPGVLKANSYCHACAVRQDTSDLIALGDDEEGKESVQENGISGQPVQPAAVYVSPERVSDDVATQATRWEDALEKIELIHEAHWKPVSLQHLPNVASNAKLLVIDSNTNAMVFWFIVLFLMEPILAILGPVVFISLKILSDISDDAYGIIVLILSIIYLFFAFMFYRKNCIKTYVYISDEMVYVDSGMIKNVPSKRIGRNSYTRAQYDCITVLNKYIVYLNNGMESVPIANTWNEQTAIRMTEMMQRIMNLRWKQPSLKRGGETYEENHCDRCEPALQREFEGDIGCDRIEVQGFGSGSVQASREKGQSMSSV